MRRPDVTAKRCEDCGERVAVHRDTYDHRFAVTARAGRRIRIVCDYCASVIADRSPALVVAPPTTEEIEEANQ